jgi:hypothetical protein
VIELDGLTKVFGDRVAVDDLTVRIEPALRVGRESFLAVTTTWPVGLAVTGAWTVGAWALGALLLERRDL